MDARQKVSLQKIFGFKNKLQYFVVDPSLAIPPATSPASLFLASAADRVVHAEKVILPAPDVRCLTAFLAKTRWKEAIVGLTPAYIMQLIDLPFGDMPLVDVCEAVSDYFQWAADDVVSKVTTLIGRMAKAKSG